MINERFIALVNSCTTERSKHKDFEELTGIKRSTVKAVMEGRQRMNSEHLDLIGQRFPEYIYWLVTGKTVPEAGQISPDLSGTRTSLKDAIVSILESAEATGTLLTPEQTADLILEQLNARQDDRVKSEEAI